MRVEILFLLVIVLAIVPLQAQSEALDKRFDDLRSELKDDIADLKDVVRDGFDAINRRIDDQNKRIDDQNKRIDDLKIELKGDISDLKGELKGDIKDLRSLFYWLFGGIGAILLVILGAVLSAWLNPYIVGRIAKNKTDKPLYDHREQPSLPELSAKQN